MVGTDRITEAGLSIRSGRMLRRRSKVERGATTGSLQQTTHEAKIEEKKVELERVYQNHDSMVRELFHMDHFRTMLTYDPEEAEQDDSAVFRNYKAQFDLVEASTSSSRQRRTRSIQNDTSSMFGQPSISAPPLKRRKTIASDTAGIIDILNSAKVKGKGKAIEGVPETAPVAESPKAKRKNSSAKPRSKRHVPEESISLAGPLIRKRKGHASAPEPSQEADTIALRVEKRRHGKPVIHLKPSSTPKSPVQLLPPPSPIKRIRLIVRKPPPQFSNPQQIPPPPKFGNSLEKLIPTFSHWEDENIELASLDICVREEAVLRERAAKIKREGGFWGSLAELGNDVQCDPKRTGYQGREPDKKDHWDFLLEEVVEDDEKRRERPTGQDIASVIASTIKVYWEAQVAKQDKARVQEEKRLRGLAKATMKMVTAEWKKAVFHIREQEKLRLEAEERIRGQQHLDAILSQSGALLETQHADLSKRDPSRSLSRQTSSASSLRDLDDESSEEEGPRSDDGREEEDSDADDEDSQDGVEPPIDLSLDLSALYDDYAIGDAGDPPAVSSPIFSRSPSSNSRRSTRPSTPMDEDPPIALQSYTMDVDQTSSVPLVPSTPSRNSSPTSEMVVTPPYDSSMIQLPDKPTETETHFEESISPDTIFVPIPAKEGHHSTPEVDTLLQPQSPSPEQEQEEQEDESEIPEYLKPYFVAPVKWDPDTQVTQPSLLRGVLRPYQASGLEWLASLHTNNLNGILADEMGLGKTIQTISLLAHLACDRGIWGPHLIIVPTSVILNWEMEFKKFLPGFKILSYHGNTKRRKELRQGWYEKHKFNVCITSYTLASRDAHIFKRKPWYYMILDEAHMIKNFKSQRWNILLMFRSFRRLLLTGTPLQNNLTELWALLQFLMSGSNFANLKEFGEWFSNPLEKAIEMGTILDDEDTLQRITKLHTVLRPYLLRRLKRDVEKELPSKFEHLVLCPLSKRQRYLYDEFMSRAQTQNDLESGVYQKIANILMQLRKVCNHPDLFEVRPVKTSFVMGFGQSAVGGYEGKERLIRGMLMGEEGTSGPGYDFLGLRPVDLLDTSEIRAIETHRLDASHLFPSDYEFLSNPPPKDTRTIRGFKKYEKWRRKADELARWNQVEEINEIRCSSETRMPVYSSETIKFLRGAVQPTSAQVLSTSLVRSYMDRADDMKAVLERYTFVTPSVVARDLPRLALPGFIYSSQMIDANFDAPLHLTTTRLQIAFPDAFLLQYDCGKLQKLASLLRERKAGGHRVLIFTQMTRILDILEQFLNLHGYLYLRLDGATKIEDRQYVTERFNRDEKVFCFIASSRSGGVGINLTGADTVIFYDSDFNPQMDRQCEDRAHRIGQIRDVHIYRFVSEYTVEEAMLKKAEMKRELEGVVIQRGGFDWRGIFGGGQAEGDGLRRALGEFDDLEDARAAELAAREEAEGEVVDNDDFGGETEMTDRRDKDTSGALEPSDEANIVVEDREEPQPDADEEGGTVVEYMLAFVKNDYGHFQDWRV